MIDSKRVILIGLDGLGRGEVGEWIDDGTLPTLGSLSGTGTEAVLESTHPPWTPCAWPSLASGRNPGEHGVFDFFTREGESYEKRLVDRRDVRAPYLWEVADACGLSSVVINFPVTHPASDLDSGALVPGYLASEDVEFHPPDVRTDFEDEYGEYRIYPQYDAGSEAVAEYTDVARCRRDMARLLDARYDWDLLAVQFQVTDSVFHDLEDREEIEAVLQQVDGYVDDVTDLAPDATVFVVSDHGMGDYEWTFYMNTWLADHDYCRVTAGEAAYFRERKSDLLATNGENATPDGSDTSVGGRLVGRTADALAALGLPPERIHRGLSTVGLAEVVERVLPEETLLAAQRRTVDWAHSGAFQLYFNSLGIHINRDDSNDSVEEKEGHEVAWNGTDGDWEHDYETFRNRLIADLRAITDPDGNRVFEDVKPREAVYEGANVDMAPDVLVFPREYAYDVSGSIATTFRSNPHKNHEPDGLFVTDRPLELGTELTHASIYDVAPTVAACLGIPIDTDTDGEMLPILDRDCELDDRAWSDFADSYRTVETERSSGDVEARLADLGYME